MKIKYVSRTRFNNGISAIVSPYDSVKPFDAGLITVAGSGNSVLESFIQPKPFYTGDHVFVLTPLKAMSEIEKLFYCYCIKENQYRYSFGRQANKTINSLLLPSEVPSEFKNIIIENEISLSNDKLDLNSLDLNVSEWKYFPLKYLFIVEKGHEVINKCTLGNTPLVSATGVNNGVSSYVTGKKIFKGNTITVAMNGASTGESFYQTQNFYATSDVNILKPKFEINKYIGLFICSVLRQEKYRFNYGRKWSKDRMENDKIKLPTIKGEPNYAFMEKYIKTLDFSSAI